MFTELHCRGRTLSDATTRLDRRELLTQGEKQDGTWRLRSGNPAIVGLASVRPVALRPHLSMGLPLAVERHYGEAHSRSQRINAFGANVAVAPQLSRGLTHEKCGFGVLENFGRSVDHQHVAFTQLGVKGWFAADDPITANRARRAGELQMRWRTTQAHSQAREKW